MLYRSGQEERVMDRMIKSRADSSHRSVSEDSSTR